MLDDFQTLIADAQAADAEDGVVTPTTAQPCPPQPIVDEEALKVAKAALVGACDYFPWVGPLLESIAMGATRGVVFATPWGGSATGVEPTPDAEKHAAYVTYMERTILEAAPWVMSLLDCAGATVIAGPGVLCFMVPHQIGTAHDIPQLQQLTRLLPWTDPDDVAH